MSLRPYSRGKSQSESDSIISVTYSELNALIELEKLNIGEFYEISDFQTLHLMHNTTVRNDTNLDIPIEPLYVLAVSTTAIDRIAYSKLYPNDYIEYTLDNSWWGSLVADNSKGAITRRISSDLDPDFKSVNTNYDWRHAGFRRWNCQNLYRKTGLANNYVLYKTSLNIGKLPTTSAGMETWASSSVEIAMLSDIAGNGTANININGTNYAIDLSSGVEAGIDSWISTNEATLNALLVKVVKSSSNSIEIYYPSAWSNVTFTETAATATASILTKGATYDYVDTHTFAAGKTQDVLIQQTHWYLDEESDSALPNVVFNGIEGTQCNDVMIGSADNLTISANIYHFRGCDWALDVILSANIVNQGYWMKSQIGYLESVIITNNAYVAYSKLISSHRKDGEGNNSLAGVEEFASMFTNYSRGNPQISGCFKVHVATLSGANKYRFMVDRSAHVYVEMNQLDDHNPPFLIGFWGERYLSTFNDSFKDLSAQTQDIMFDYYANRSNLTTEKTIVAGVNHLTMDMLGNNFDQLCSYWSITGVSGDINTMANYGARTGVVRYLIPVAGVIATINNNDAADGIITDTGAALIVNGSNNEIARCEWNPITLRWYASKA